jgi:hypothetical protein
MFSQNPSFSSHTLQSMTTPLTEPPPSSVNYTIFLAAQDISENLSKIQHCLEFFGEGIISSHKDGDLRNQASKLTSGVLFDLQQYAAFAGKSLEFFLDQHLSSEKLLEWPTQISDQIESLDIKRYERDVELDWPADVLPHFQSMLRGMQTILTTAYEIQTQLQLGRVQVTQLKNMLRNIASFVNAMSVHLFPDPEGLADRVIYPASNEIPTEVFDAMVATETKVKRCELKMVVDNLTLRVKSAAKAIDPANNKKRARITGVSDASSSSSFYEEPSSYNNKREKLKPKLPTGCFSSLPTYKP